MLDTLQVELTIVNNDTGESCYATQTYTNSTIDITSSYVDSMANALPDGMYSIYVAAKTSNSTKTVIMNQTLVGGLALKRTKPPEPNISQDSTSKEISIDYPEDSSVFPSVLMDKYKKTYKFTPAGGSADPTQDYEGEFTVDKDGNITAYYTDFAGNISTSTKFVYADSSPGSDIRSTGNDVHTEENRQATVYYINTRRKSDTGLKGEIFEFLK